MKHVWTLARDTIPLNGRINSSRDEFFRRNNEFFIKANGNNYSLVSTINSSDTILLTPATNINMFTNEAGGYLELTTANSMYFFCHK